MDDISTRLKPLTVKEEKGKEDREITLVPYSGIQILDFGFSLDGSDDIKRSFFERKIGEEGESEVRQLIPLAAKNEEAVDIPRGPYDSAVYSIDRVKGLEPFLGHWVPVPVLRVNKDRSSSPGEQYDQGPTSWARARVCALDRPDPATGHTYRVQLALDTTLVPSAAEDRYIAPHVADVTSSREFRFASEHLEVSWFVSNPKPDPDEPETLRDLQRWVSDWVLELFLEWKEAEKAKTSTRKFDPDKDLPFRFEHWARYLQFLRLLGTAIEIPRMRFLNTQSPEEPLAPVDVDLILDVGNSRTCGILVERFPGEAEVDLTSSYPLMLRDLSKPELYYGGLIESHVEFAELSFGKDRFASASGRGSGFAWPSFVRIGPEARRLTQSDQGTETTSGLSSPKRYLWDTTPVRQDWRFQGHKDPSNLPRSARVVMQYLNDAGDVLLGSNRSREPSAIRPRFSRSAVYGFMLAEIISHALVQINDPGGRSRRKQTDLPRRLDRIILTLPTATPIQEQKIIGDRARGALELVWKRLGMGDVAKMPKLHVSWDEASCTQLVYLYSEITQRANGKISEYLSLKGRRRTRPVAEKGKDAPRQEEPSLRLACIDVGGGTTDLMITTYFGHDDAVLQPHQTFREGFRIAGDDLIRRVIGRVVLPALAASATAAGGQHIRETVDELFAGDLGGQDQQFVQMRRQFVLRALRPMATALIAACETAEVTDRIEIGFADLLHLRREGSGEGHGVQDPGVAPTFTSHLLTFLEAPPQRQGASGWTLADVILSVERAEIDNEVRNVFSVALGDMVEVIGDLGCDVILLTGRPSKLPALRDIVESAMVVPPDRVVSMHRYKPGGWYPYRKISNGSIDDPKSTVAVGGMLMALAGSRIPNFKVETDAFRMRSTARFIGQMEDSGEIKPQRVLFVPPELKSNPRSDTAVVHLYNPMQIGFRQLELDRWTTTPLYRLDFGEDEARTRKPPLKVTLRRAERDELDEDAPIERILEQEAKLEELLLEEVVDGNDYPVPVEWVSLRLQTLGLQGGYWLDTGVVSK